MQVHASTAKFLFQCKNRCYFTTEKVFFQACHMYHAPSIPPGLLNHTTSHLPRIPAAMLYII
jgi:hypothetical protein